MVAAVNDTSTNRLGHRTQFREALLYAKQLLKDGILSRDRQSEREEPLCVPSSSSSCVGISVGLGHHDLKGTESTTAKGGTVIATAVERRWSFREVPPTSVEATTVAMCAPTARKNIPPARNSISGSEYGIGALNDVRRQLPIVEERAANPVEEVVAAIIVPVRPNKKNDVQTPLVAKKRKQRQCEVGECTKQAKKGGLCSRH